MSQPLNIRLVGITDERAPSGPVTRVTFHVDVPPGLFADVQIPLEYVPRATREEVLTDAFEALHLWASQLSDQTAPWARVDSLQRRRRG